MDKPTNGIGYEVDERVFRKRKPTKINLPRNGTVKVAIPGVPLLNIFSRQKHKPGIFFFIPFSDYQRQAAKSRT